MSEKTIGVKVGGIEYLVPFKYVTALRRKFDGQRVAKKGLGIDDARAFLCDRAAGWQRGVEVKFAPGVAPEVRARDCYRFGLPDAKPDTTRPNRHIAQVVCHTLAERLVRKWARDGVLERCGFGRYRKASKA